MDIDRSGRDREKSTVVIDHYVHGGRIEATEHREGRTVRKYWLTRSRSPGGNRTHSETGDLGERKRKDCVHAKRQRKGTHLNLFSLFSLIFE